MNSLGSQNERVCTVQISSELNVNMQANQIPRRGQPILDEGKANAREASGGGHVNRREII